MVLLSEGQGQAYEYYQELESGDRIKVLKLFKMMGDVGKIRDETKFRNEGDKVYAFKSQPHRFLSFFVEGKKIIVTNAFWKKQDKLPPGTLFKICDLEKPLTLNSLRS